MEAADRVRAHMRRLAEARIRALGIGAHWSLDVEQLGDADLFRANVRFRRPDDGEPLWFHAIASDPITALNDAIDAVGLWHAREAAPITPEAELPA